MSCDQVMVVGLVSPVVLSARQLRVNGIPGRGGVGVAFIMTVRAVSGTRGWETV